MMFFRGSACTSKIAEDLKTYTCAFIMNLSLSMDHEHEVLNLDSAGTRLLALISGIRMMGSSLLIRYEACVEMTNDDHKVVGCILSVVELPRVDESKRNDTNFLKLLHSFSISFVWESSTPVNYMPDVPVQATTVIPFLDEANNRLPRLITKGGY
uniref:Uncharacterized protein n=1 Tax=Tanacetum cinerariifolium TaxID=118510 RepID=A0A6L2MMK4_TANCI|nr:hypothetical protein [Tanacetum cinerariifolium]